MVWSYGARPTRLPDQWCIACEVRCYKLGCQNETGFEDHTRQGTGLALGFPQTRNRFDATLFKPAENPVEMEGAASVIYCTPSFMGMLSVQ